MSNAKRFSNADLKEFQSLIEHKLEKSRAELVLLKEQLDDLKSHFDERSDLFDDSHNQSDSEMLVKMMTRQQKHAQDLENALLRIQNKTYGICSITGELIDKRRLLAVPTTSKSLDAKTAINRREQRGTSAFKSSTRNSSQKIISKQKPVFNPTDKPNKMLVDNLLDGEESSYDEALENVEELDLKEELEE